MHVSAMFPPLHCNRIPQPADTSRFFFFLSFFYSNRRKSGAQQGVYLVVRNLRSAGGCVMTNVRPTNPTNGTGVTFLWEMLACGELVNTE